jgi:fatty-acid peroxygenase
MPPLPRAKGFDHTLALVREGYGFIGNRCQLLGSDVFEARLALRRVICMRGAAAAEFFYAGERFTRRGAMPVTVVMLLQDFGSVQLLEGSAHKHRKAMFKSLATPAAAADLAAQFADEWRTCARRWEARQEPIVLFDEVESMLTRTGARWAGAPLDDAEARPRTREFSEMLAATGSIGPRTWRALWLRRRTEKWARRIIDAVRSGTIRAASDSALRTVALHRAKDGRLLTTKVAAVELINVLRPIVAVARFIVFAAKALHEHPGAKARIAAGDAEYLDHFVQEVRRTAPFFAFISGRARQSLQWRGHRFDKGTWVLLDLYGTNRDPSAWPDPDVFDPERFARRSPTLFDFVPQGAGDASVTHRCPGEAMTVELTTAAVRQLADLDYEVPDQDLSVDLSRIPALPASGFVISRPRLVSEREAPMQARSP